MAKHEVRGAYPVSDGGAVLLPGGGGGRLGTAGRRSLTADGAECRGRAGYALRRRLTTQTISDTWPIHRAPSVDQSLNNTLGYCTRSAAEQTRRWEFFGRRSSTVERPSTWTTAAGTYLRLLQTISENSFIWRSKCSVTLLNVHCIGAI